MLKYNPLKFKFICCSCGKGQSRCLEVMGQLLESIFLPSLCVSQALNSGWHHNKCFYSLHHLTGLENVILRFVSPQKTYIENSQLAVVKKSLMNKLWNCHGEFQDQNGPNYSDTRCKWRKLICNCIVPSNCWL